MSKLRTHLDIYRRFKFGKLSKLYAKGESKMNQSTLKENQEIKEALVYELSREVRQLIQAQINQLSKIDLLRSEIADIKHLMTKPEIEYIKVTNQSDKKKE